MIDETRVVPAPLFVAARAILSVSILGAALWSSACAGSPVQDSTSPKHGVMSERTAASDARLCEHGVPGDVCVRCHAHLTDEFKATGDWCPGHDVPESQCFACHPGLSFEPLPTLRSDADWEVIAKDGADVASLEAHVATGKVTIFDFYAVWCAPCRKVDAHIIKLVNSRDDVAIRKLDMASWDTPLAKRYLQNVRTLPHVIVYGKDGRKVAAINGLDLAALDAAIAMASLQAADR